MQGAGLDPCSASSWVRGFVEGALCVVLLGVLVLTMWSLQKRRSSRSSSAGGAPSASDDDEFIAMEAGLRPQGPNMGSVLRTRNPNIGSTNPAEKKRRRRRVGINELDSVTRMDLINSDDGGGGGGGGVHYSGPYTVHYFSAIEARLRCV